MKTYKIEKTESGKYVVVYFINGKEETREHYAGKDGVQSTEIRIGYTKLKDSL